MNRRRIYVAAIGIILIFLFSFYGQLGTIEVDRAFWFSGLGITLIVLSSSTLVTLKHFSPQIITNEFANSYCGDTKGRKDDNGLFSILYVGGWSAFGLNRRGRDATVICPTAAVNEIGANRAINCDLKKVKNLRKLPDEVYDYLEQKDIEEPVYFGLGTPELFEMTEEQRKEEFELSEEELAKLEKMYMEQSEYINDLKDMLQGKMENLEDFVSSVGRINQQDSSKSIGDVLRDYVKSRKNGGSDD